MGWNVGKNGRMLGLGVNPLIDGAKNVMTTPLEI